MENFISYLIKYNPNIENIFSKNVKNTLNILYETASEQEKNIYLVGGIVRDIFLNRNSADIDLVLEGSSQEFAQIILPKFPVAKHRFTERFLTYNIFTKTGTNIDIASFREEIYEYPGALPTVTPASIENDYLRRDFTINAMYISFDNNAKLYDPLNGLKDIENKIIRVIHEKSFEDDPTRIFRAVKFAARYNFNFDNKTDYLLKEAMEKRFLASISNTRLKNEIYMLLAEKNLKEILRLFREYKIFDFLNIPNPSDEDIEEIYKITIHPFFKKIKYENKISKGNFILLFFMRNLSPDEKSEILKIFELSEKNLENLIFKEGEAERINLKLSRKTLQSHIYKQLVHIAPFKIAYLFFIYKENRKKLKKFIFDLRNENAIISGGDLLKAGFSQDASLGKYLQKCFMIQLDMKNPTKEKIISKLMEDIKSNG